MFQSIFQNGSWDFLETNILGNQISDYLIFLVSLLVLGFVFAFFRSFAVKRLKENSQKIKEKGVLNILIDFALSIRPAFYFYLAFYISLSFIQVPRTLFDFFTAILFFWATFRLMYGAQMFVDYFLEKKILKDSDPNTKVAGKNIGLILKAVLWIFVLLLVLSNLGIEVTSLVAGLGIGGIAVAFAFQNILQDLFSSFAIFFDKPFTVGDFIIVGDDLGTVEHIGIKTTRLRALQGEEIVISNRELTNVRVHNFKKLEKRRISFHFGVVYGTSDEKMEKIPKIVEKLIEKEELADFDRAHFVDFADWSLNFEVVYYILSSDFTEYRNTHQNILLGIKKEFAKEDISMAFPTKTIHLSKE